MRYVNIFKDAAGKEWCSETVHTDIDDALEECIAYGGYKGNSYICTLCSSRGQFVFTSEEKAEYQERVMDEKANDMFLATVRL